MAFGGVADVGEDALDIAEIGPPARVEPHAASPTVEQDFAEMLFEHADAVGNGGGGDAEFLGGAGEAFAPGGGFEEAEAVQGRERWHGQMFQSTGDKIPLDAEGGKRPARRDGGRLGVAIGCGRSDAGWDAAPVTHSAQAPGGGQDVFEDALDVGVILTAAQGEADAARPTLEERRAQMALEHADPVGDGGGGDAEFLGGAGEALVSCRGVEEAQTVERRKGRHGMGGLRLPVETISFALRQNLVCAQEPVVPGPRLAPLLHDPMAFLEQSRITLR